MWVNGFGHLNKTNLQTIKEKQNEQIFCSFFLLEKDLKRTLKRKIRKKFVKIEKTTLKTVEKKEW